MSDDVLQADLLHLVHGDSVPEDQLHAFLTWYSVERPETRHQRMRTDNKDGQLEVDDGDNNSRQRRHQKLADSDDRSPPTSDNSGETPVAVTLNRWFLHGAKSAHDDVDSGSTSDEYRDRAGGSHWADDQAPSFNDYVDHSATRRHRYDSWYQGDVDVTAHLSQVSEQRGEETAEARYRDEDDDRQTPPAHRHTASPVDRRHSSSLVDYASLCRLHQSQSDSSSRQDVAAASRSPSRDLDKRQDPSALTRGCSISPPPPPFNMTGEFRSPTTAAPPLPPGPPLSHELVRHLREQQVLRLAAVSRAIHHQLRYLHHGGGGGGGGAASPSNSAGLYPSPHRHHQFDASLLLGTAAGAASYTMHDHIMPGFRAADLALTSGRDSPGSSDVSNDNASGLLLIQRNNSYLCAFSDMLLK